MIKANEQKHKITTRSYKLKKKKKKKKKRQRERERNYSKKFNKKRIQIEKNHRK